VTQDSILIIFGGAVLTGLSGAVGVLFNMVVKEKIQNRADYEACRAENEACRKDRDVLHGRIQELSVEIGKLLGQ
jgi:hypothetical protein